LPNPFEGLGAFGALLNCFAEPIIAAVSYFIVGLFYDSGSAPALGCLAYFLVSSGIIVTLWILSIFNFAWWWILIVLICLLLIAITFLWLVGKLFWY